MSAMCTSQFHAGSAVAHKHAPQVMQGRIKRLASKDRAWVVWVRRALPSLVQIRNLTPITDETLEAFYAQQEAMHERLHRDPDPFDYDIVDFRPTSDENRRFLLNEPEGA